MTAPTITHPYRTITLPYSEINRWLGNKKGEKRKNRCKSEVLRKAGRWMKADGYI